MMRSDPNGIKSPRQRKGKEGRGKGGEGQRRAKEGERRGKGGGKEGRRRGEEGAKEAGRRIHICFAFLYFSSLLFP
jgi:hypothetical protein